VYRTSPAPRSPPFVSSMMAGVCQSPSEGQRWMLVLPLRADCRRTSCTASGGHKDRWRSGTQRAAEVSAAIATTSTPLHFHHASAHASPPSPSRI
jgi:hypothetical protein